MRTVVGLYDRMDEAQRAIDALIKAGIPSDKVGIIASDAEGKYSQALESRRSGQEEDAAEGAATGAGIGAALGGLGGLLLGLGALAIPGIGPVVAAGPIVSALAGAGIGAATGGILGALVDLGIPEEHANSYAEGVRRGGTLVYAQVEESQANNAAEIMNRFKPVDINERSQHWKENKWSGFDEKSKPWNSKEVEQERSRFTQENVPVTGSTDNMTIPIVEEDVRIGKREVDRGGLRINTFTSQHEVEKDVNLREEHINVERRPVDREATEADFKAFKEGSVEMRETAEEPVVEKRARVVEEVHINKDVDERTETISDTIRRTEVDVEKIGSSDDWARHERTFRQDFQTRYGTTGRSFESYQPAYRYGYGLRNDPRHSKHNDWAQLEQQARTDWESRGGQQPWAEVRDAVRHAWESARR